MKPDKVIKKSIKAKKTAKTAKVFKAAKISATPAKKPAAVKAPIVSVVYKTYSLPKLVVPRPRTDARFAVPKANIHIEQARDFGRKPSWLGKAFQLTALTLAIVLISLPAISAFEAHLINVTAEVVQIDPPVKTVPGDIGWDNPNGGANLAGDQDIIMSDDDPDATHIFYTFGPGIDPNVIPDPVCGGPLGGPKNAPQHLVISSDTTIKTIACDGPSSSAHFSLINTKIYTFAVPCEDRFIPLDVMIVFDKSGSMLTGGKLAGAKTAAKDFLDVLDSTRDQAGLVSFSTSAFLNQQLTNDFASVKSSINGLSASGSTNIGDAISKANVELMSARARGNSTKLEILLTDGKANRPGSGDDNPAAVALAQAKADEAAANGFLLYTIGLGADVNAAFLTDLAERTGGQYFESADVGQLSEIYRQITHLVCGNATVSGYKFEDLDQNGQKDAGEPGVPGWRVTLKRGQGTFGTALTNAEGFYEFTELPGGVEFSLVEESRPGWQPINPVSGKIDVNLSDGQNLTGQNFANFNTGQQCTPDVVSFPGGVVVLAAGKHNGDNDDILVSSHVTVNGTVRGNDDVKATDHNANRSINGDVKAGDNVENQSGFVLSPGHSILENQSLTSLPDLHLSLWKDRANDGGTVNGSLIFPDNTGGIEVGPSEILGNVVFGHGDNVTVKGPLYIHGDLTINDDTTITEASSLGNNFAIIIVDGTINIDDGVKFVGSGTSGAFLLVSTAAPTNSGSIQVSSDDSDLGRAVLYAGEGNVKVGQERKVMAVFAKHGKNSSKPAIVLDKKVAVLGGVLPSQIACGPSVSPNNNLEHVLINEFVANAKGSDSAGKPKGEWVELFNNSASTVDVNGWVLTDALAPTVGSTQNKQWTSSSDFSGGAFNNTFVENSGGARVRVQTTFTSGTYEKVFDAGAGKQGQWQNISWNENLSAGADICLAAATSDDGSSYSAYSAPDCSSPFDVSGLTASRFIKWKSAHSRGNGLVSNNSDLLDLTLSYKPVSFAGLVIGPGNTDTGATTIASHDYLVVYRNGNSDFDLDNTSGSVGLYDGQPLVGANQIDFHIYNFPGGAPEGKSFTRMPDGTANWIDPEATPGEPNDEFVSPDIFDKPQVEFVESSPVEEEVLEEPKPGESDYIDPEKLEEEIIVEPEPETATTTGDSEVLGEATTTPENVEEPASEPETQAPGSEAGAPSSPQPQPEDPAPETGSESENPPPPSESPATHEPTDQDDAESPDPASTNEEANPATEPADTPDTTETPPAEAASGSTADNPPAESEPEQESEPVDNSPPPSTEPESPPPAAPPAEAPASN